MKNEGIGRRLDMVVEKFYRSRVDMSLALGLSTFAVQSWVARDSMPRNMYERVLKLLPELREEWLRHGEGEMLKENVTVPEPGNRHAYYGVPTDDDTLEQAMMKMKLERYYSNRPTKLVEEVSVMCGDVPVFNEHEHFKDYFLPGGCCRYMFRCSGISMEPRLYDGDYVGVNDPMMQYEKFDSESMYLIFTMDGKAMVKYVEDPGVMSEYLNLKTLNKNYKLSDSGRLDKNEVRRIYKVVMTLNWKV